MSDINEQIAAAMEKLEADPDTSSSPAPSPAPAPAPVEQQTEVVHENQSEEADTSASPEGRQRGPDGKFLPKGDKVSSNQEQKPEEVKPGAPTPAPTPAPTAAPAPATFKAPVSWRPEVRGKFGSLPAEVQEEVVRREREIENGLREASQTRQFTKAFYETVRPYEAMLQAENAHPLEAVKSFFNTAYVLRTGSPQQKAQMVANLIGQFGINIDVLDNVLTAQLQGKPMRDDPVASHIQRELEPIKQFMTELKDMRTQALSTRQQSLQEEVNEFQSKNSEFWDDVKEDVADLLELAARRGQKLSLQDAFTRATMAHPTIGKIISDRKLAESAAQRSAAASRSRNASASLPSGSAPEAGNGNAQKPKDMTSAIAQAWDTVEARSR